MNQRIVGERVAARRRESALLLRPWSETDAVGLREAIDEDVAHLRPWLSWSLEEPASLEHTRVRLREYVDQLQKGRAFRYAITPLDRPSVILGGAGLNCRVGPAAHDVGYWVRRSAVRKGVASAAVSALVIHAFSWPAVQRLVIQCDVANTASAATARALGFEFARAAMARYPDGTPRPLFQFELSRESYALRHAPSYHQRARRVLLATEPPASTGSDGKPRSGSDDRA